MSTLPQIGEYQSRVSPFAEAPMAQMRPLSTGAGVGAIGDALQKIQEQDSAVQATKLLATAQSDWMTNLEQRKQSAEPGAPNFTPNLMKEYGDYTAKVLKAAPRGEANRFLQERMASFGNELQQRALQYEAGERVANNTNIAKSSIDAAGNEVMTDPTAFAPRLAERRALIDAMPFTPDAKRQLTEYAQKSLSKFAVIGQINANPYATMMQLVSANPTDLAIRALDPEIRMQLFDHADAMTRERLAEAARLETMQDRQKKLVEQDVAKSGEQLLANLQLSARWIESNRDKLDPADYRYFYNALSKDQSAAKTERSDPTVYSDLIDRAHQGQDVRDEARRELVNKRITIASYDKINSETDQARPNWFKRGSEFISTSAAVSQLNPDPAAAQRKASMLDDWQDWANHNPKATDDQARKAYRDLVHEYAIVDLTGLTLTKRAPTYLVGSRNAPDIDATEAATVRALENHEIDETEFARQAQLLKEWRTALQRATPKPGVAQ